MRRRPARAIIISYCPGQFLPVFLFIISSIHLSTDFTHSSFLGVVPLPHIRIALCLCLRISILPYCLMALCHCCIYTFLLLLLRLFLRTNVWRIEHISLYFLSTITTALSKNDPSAYRIPHIPRPRECFYIAYVAHHIT